MRSAATHRAPAEWCWHCKSNFGEHAGDGLKEQLEGLRAAQSAAQKKMAGEIDALNKEVQAATEKASAEAASHGTAFLFVGFRK